MANLNGQNIGTNYKGIINIGSTINQNVSASLQSLSDGDGNILPIQVSTTRVIIGGATGTGVLAVRGDGTNPIARFEDNAGNPVLTLPATNGVTNSMVFSGEYLGFRNSAINVIGIASTGFSYLSSAQNRFFVSTAGVVTTYNKINLFTATTAAASLNFGTGVAPTTPVNGDVWFDGTNLNIRVGGTTKTFTLA